MARVLLTGAYGQVGKPLLKAERILLSMPQLILMLKKPKMKE